jgi:hypothetical protein
MTFYYQKLLYHAHHNFFIHHKEGDLKGYRLSKIENYCCHEMMSALNAKSISFGDLCDPEEDDTNETTNDLNINLVKGEGGRYSTTYTFKPISNCPFCGQKIELKEKGEVYVNKVSEGAN